MENNHRKKEEKEVETRKRSRSPSDAVEPAGTRSEEEVEEFFAIIRRMHVAARMSRSGKPSSVAAVEKKTGTMDWRPMFSLEDFGKVDEDADGESRKLGSSADKRPSTAVNRNGIDRGGSGGGVCLDLNAEPESEGVPG